MIVIESGQTWHASAPESADDRYVRWTHHLTKKIKLSVSGTVGRTTLTWRLWCAGTRRTNGSFEAPCISRTRPEPHLRHAYDLALPAIENLLSSSRTSR